MKKLISSVSALAFGVSAATAGTLTEPVVEEVMEPEMEAAGSSSGGILVPLLLLGVVAALIASNGDDDDADTEEEIQLSDVRLKRDIQHVGIAKNGLNLYNYKYLWSNKTYQGVMAQEVLKHTPDAVIIGRLGNMSVNYAKLGMKMVQIH